MTDASVVVLRGVVPDVTGRDGYGDGNGYGSGYGDGTGYGYGYKDGSGYGHWHGGGHGDGYSEQSLIKVSK